MSIDKILNFLRGIASIAGITAIFAFTYTIYKDYSIRQRQFAQNWQSVEIFDVVLKSGTTGMTLQEIVSTVQSSMIEGKIFSEIDPAMAGEKQVLRGIIDLASNNSILFATDGRYRVPTQSAGWLTQDMMNQLNSMYQEEVINMIVASPNKFSTRELIDYLMSVRNATYRQAHMAVMGLVLSGPWGPSVLIGRDPLAAPDPDETLIMRDR